MGWRIFGLKECPVPHASDNGEGDLAVTGGFQRLRKLIPRQPHSLGRLSLLLWKENKSGRIAFALVSRKSMHIAVLSLTRHRRTPDFPDVVFEWDQIGPRSHVDRGRLPTVLDGFFQD